MNAPMRSPQRAIGTERLSSGGLIDRGRPLAFSFDGRTYTGAAGDTLASALVANSVRLVGRSFKYHRPRGIVTAGPEEPNALVEIGTGARRDPNCKATTVELHDGLVARSQNRWPSLDLDLMAAAGFAGKLLGAGFYYKTFMWPAFFWETVYEPLIRRAAGLGCASGVPDPDRYETAHAFCDVLVIGAGPAGLMAALAAGRAGARVILCEEDFAFGGRLLAETLDVDGMPGAAWAAGVLEKLAALPRVRLLPRTAVFGVYDGGTYGAIEKVTDHLADPPAHLPRQRFWRIVAGRAVLATGALERPIVFPGNDLPGVMQASAVRGYANRFAAAAGRSIAVFTCCDDGWRTARDLAGHVTTIIDSRPAIDERLMAAAHAAGIKTLSAGLVTRAHGSKILTGLTVSARGATERIACDCLAVAGGWNPLLSLTAHHGARPRWRDDIAAFVPDRAPPGMRVAGAANGMLSLAGALREGQAAGQAAAEAAGFSAPAQALPCAEDESVALSPLWHVAGAGKAFVDLQNDVTVEDIAIAHAEGFRPVEHMKRYTTLGMATDQGRMSNVSGIAIMAELTGRTIPETGTTMFRPPYAPVAIGALAGGHRGREFVPTRRSPLHRWAESRGCVFAEIGLWLRMSYFPEPGEADWLDAVKREVAAVRGDVGFCDVSSLGKIDVQGPDAAAFLDHVYANTFSTLGVGRARYGLMLREDGFVMDDGTTSRLAPDHFLMTTTTANAGKVMQHLEFCRQVLWPKLDVALTSVSEHWAQVAIAGPRAREIVTRLADPGSDVGPDAMPFMAARELTIAGGVPARLFRISFSGELAYELAVPAGYGAALAERLCHWGATPYGLETLNTLRIEKGHVAGAELDGRTTAADLGLGRMLSTKKDFIGSVMARRPGLTDPDRPALVGLRPVDPAARLRSGAHFVAAGRPVTAEHDEGHMTSTAYSPTLGHWIGLGLLRRGPERHGEVIRAVDPVRDGDVAVEVVLPCFVDPEGARQRG